MNWLLLVLLVCTSGRCSGGTYNGFQYSVSGSDVTITGYGGPDFTTIPSSIPGVGTVTTIGEGAFTLCSRLTSLTIPDSVTSIGDYAFTDCYGLTSVTIPGGVTSIGVWAFEGCERLANVTIGSRVASIGDYAFQACSSLASVTIPGSVTSIGDYAFQTCSGLTNITIGNGVTSIGEGAFEQCERLAGVTIPGSVTSIGEGAFMLCSRLTSVAIPSSVTSIGDQAFYFCSSLAAFTVDTQNPSYSSLDGVLFDKYQTTLLQCPPEKAGAYTIPGSVTSIGDEAFSYCSSLTGVAIPSSVTSIGDQAFSFCSRLAAFTVDAQNPSYSSLGGVLFDKHQTTLLQWPPEKAGAYTIPGGVTSIADSAFEDCNKLTSVTIPGSVTSIGYAAFYGCGRLTTAFFQGNPPPSFGIAVFWQTALYSIYYPSKSTGWTTPTWNGYPARPYVYTPPAQFPTLSLMRGLGTVTPSFTSLQLGTNYQLQVSTDLSTWTNTGAAFIATSASELYPQPFDVSDWSQLFFRLRSAP